MAVLPGLRDNEAEILISAVPSAATGVFVPAIFNDRSNRLASLAGLSVAVGGAGVLLWVLNGGLSVVMLSPAVGAPLLTQTMILAVLITAGTLWNRRRQVLFNVRGGLRRPRHDTFPLVISLLLVFVPLVGLPWTGMVVWRAYAHWTTGWQVMLCAGLVLGVIAGYTLNAVLGLLNRHWRPAWEELTDQMVWNLHYLAWVLVVDRPTHLRPKDLRAVRTAIDQCARIIEANPLPARPARWYERALRRHTRKDHMRVAAALRNHSRSIASVRTFGDYDKITDSITRGALASAMGDWDALLLNTPEVNLVSRVARMLRRLSPALLLAAAALAIPMLPGAGSAAGGVRILLLSTAVLALLPATETTRADVRSALDKALFK